MMDKIDYDYRGMQYAPGPLTDIYSIFDRVAPGISPLNHNDNMDNYSNRKILREIKEENKYYNKLSAFMAEISHEVGNPLTSVIMTLQVLLKNISRWNNEEKKEYVELSIKELKRLSKFLENLQNLNRENTIEKKNVMLKDFIEGFISQTTALSTGENLSFINKINESIRVTIDEDTFYRVIFNLFTNSLDCLRGTGIDGKIEISVESFDDCFVKLVYKNNGPLIPMENLEKIFMPFFSTRGDGRGMGLNISRKLMVRMGGAIKTEVPEAGWGARFVIYLPVE